MRILWSLKIIFTKMAKQKSKTKKIIGAIAGTAVAALAAYEIYEDRKYFSSFKKSDRVWHDRRRPEPLDREGGFNWYD